MTLRVGPVMVASGCGGTGRELASYADLAGLDFVTRTLTLDPRHGSASTRLAESPSGILNAVGLDNPGLEHFLATELPWLVREGARPFVSVAGASLGEYADLARRLGRAPGLAGIEVNLGSPDQVGLGLFEVREPYHAASVVAACRRELAGDVPILAKLRPDLTRVVEGTRSVLDAGATGVVIGHEVPAAMPDGRAAGLSGPAIAPIVRRCVTEVRDALPDAPLVATGGIASPDDARAYLDLGALAVQVGSALLHDPTTLTRVRDALAVPSEPAPQEDS